MGEQQGEGTYYYSNGDVFKGQWLQGRKHGQGVFTTGNRSYQETWDEGVKRRKQEIRFRPPRLMATKKEDVMFQDRDQLLDEVCFVPVLPGPH